MRRPLRQFCEDEGISERYAYKERVAGRLVFSKVGSRNFIDDEDGDAWRALAPKVTGKAGDVALKVAEAKLQELGKAIAEGHIDRNYALARLRKIAEAAGLQAA